MTSNGAERFNVNESKKLQPELVLKKGEQGATFSTSMTKECHVLTETFSLLSSRSFSFSIKIFFGLRAYLPSTMTLGAFYTLK